MLAADERKTRAASAQELDYGDAAAALLIGTDNVLAGRLGARQLAGAIGGKGKVAILNAPPGIIIRDQRTNGFVDGLKQHHPGIEVVADQVADAGVGGGQLLGVPVVAVPPGEVDIGQSLALVGVGNGLVGNQFGQAADR